MTLVRRELGKIGDGQIERIGLVAANGNEQMDTLVCRVPADVGQPSGSSLAACVKYSTATAHNTPRSNGAWSVSWRGERRCVMRKRPIEPS